ncbi:MAG: M3 family oligoendopeptidase [Bacteroidetes bacterium]|nr:M3 family oligoendopeptidase [Bacteroidota bacterium]
MKNAESFEIQNSALIEINKKRDDFDTMHQLAEIKFNTDVNNEVYQKEMTFYNITTPKYENLINQYYAILNNSKYKSELNQMWGSHLLELAKFAVNGFDKKIESDLKTHNKLISDYTKLKNTAKINFDGDVLNLAQISSHFQSNDREKRRNAHKARWQFFENNKTEFDDLFDNLVKNRHQMALKMECKNFVELAYNWRGRIDYNESMVANFRNQIVDEIVPICQSLRKKQKERLGYKELEIYDLNFHFRIGNPKPDSHGILSGAQKMFKELSKETHEFYNRLTQNGFLDLDSRPGKNDGGFCGYLSKYKSPFIFANFNKSASDVRVLTHEAGHAFQLYQSRQSDIVEYRLPSSETAEIHAMSMELLTYPWMSYFFGKDTQKYIYSHLTNRLLFLPFGCAIDHFQHIIYSNPDYSPNQRADVWNEMQSKYMPERNMALTPFLKSGRYWHSILHIFQIPFYMIDYALAQICAFQFWHQAISNRDEAWNNYVKLCNAGGTKSFLQLLEISNLKSPFEDGTVNTIASDILSHLNSIDDTQF